MTSPAPETTAPAPAASSSLIEEIQAAIAGGTPRGRLAALFHATDLLIAGRYSAEQTWVFGEIIGLLASEIEAAARARLAGLLANVDHAPVNVLRKLAADESIEVAAPVLSRSSGLGDDALIDCARTRGDAHLLAISRRSMLSAQVTDELITRGSQTVVRSVAANAGARFSESGFWQMIRRSENDSILAELVGARRDIPRHCFQQLIARATDEVRDRLMQVHAGAESDVQQAVCEVAGVVQARFGPASKDYYAARRAVTELHRAGELTAERVHAYARERRHNEVIAALSLLLQTTADVVERALVDAQRDAILILAKAAKLPWPAAKSILLLQADGASVSEADLGTAQRTYAQLTVATALEVLKFYRMRRRDPLAALA